MSNELIALTSACTVLTGVAGFAVWKLKQESRRIVMLLAEKRNAEEHAQKITDKWSHVTAIDAEVERLNGVASDQIALTERLRSDYAYKKVHYDRLVSEIAIYDDKLSFAEIGIYEPHFEFDTSDSYKEMIISVRNDQKIMVQLKRAVICTTGWHVNGSHREGEVMVNRNIRLTLRAFNNECEAIIANVTWRNAAASQQKIINARDQINKANASNHVVVVDEYVNLKLKEWPAAGFSDTRLS